MKNRIRETSKPRRGNVRRTNNEQTSSNSSDEDGTSDDEDEALKNYLKRRESRKYALNIFSSSYKRLKFLVWFDPGKFKF
jgi:hypothetical protein